MIFAQTQAPKPPESPVVIVTDPWGALVVIAPMVLTFASSAIAAVLAYMAKRGVSDLHVSVNSRLTQLLEEHGKSEHAEGVIVGRDSVRKGYEADVILSQQAALELARQAALEALKIAEFEAVAKLKKAADGAAINLAEEKGNAS